MEMQVVLGADGAVGRAVVRELLKNRQRVRAISLKIPEHTIPGVQHLRFQASDLRKQLADAQTVYHCAAPAYSRWAAEYPVLNRQIMTSLHDTRARLVYADNLSMYGIPRAPLEETHPHTAEDPRGRLRSQLAQHLLSAHHEGWLQVSIARASTVFGPHVHSSWTNRLFFQEVLQKQRFGWLGKLDKPHSLTFVTDFARALVLLGQHEQALGEVWHVPACWNGTALELAALLSRLQGTPIQAQQVPPLKIWLSSQLVQQHPTARDVAYQFNTPFLINSRKFLHRFDFEATPAEGAFQATLNWVRQNQG